MLYQKGVLKEMQVKSRFFSPDDPEALSKASGYLVSEIFDIINIWEFIADFTIEDSGKILSVGSVENIEHLGIFCSTLIQYSSGIFEILAQLINKPNYIPENKLEGIKERYNRHMVIVSLFIDNLITVNGLARKMIVDNSELPRVKLLKTPKINEPVLILDYNQTLALISAKYDDPKRFLDSISNTNCWNRGIYLGFTLLQVLGLYQSKKILEELNEIASDPSHKWDVKSLFSDYKSSELACLFGFLKISQTLILIEKNIVSFNQKESDSTGKFKTVNKPQSKSKAKKNNQTCFLYIELLSENDKKFAISENILKLSQGQFNKSETTNSEIEIPSFFSFSKSESLVERGHNIPNWDTKVYENQRVICIPFETGTKSIVYVNQILFTGSLFRSLMSLDSKNGSAADSSKLNPIDIPNKNFHIIRSGKYEPFISTENISKRNIPLKISSFCSLDFEYQFISLYSQRDLVPDQVIHIKSAISFPFDFNANGSNDTADSSNTLEKLPNKNGIAQNVDKIPLSSPGSPVICGHRGSGMNSKSSNVPKPGIEENTILSMKTSLSNGASFIEFDVQLTKDLVPVIHHDWRISKSNLQPFVQDLTFSAFMNSESYSTKLTRSTSSNQLSSLNKLDNQLDSLRKDKTNSINQSFVIKDGYCSLEDVLNTFGSRSGLDIELKYPMYDEGSYFGLNSVVEINTFLDSVLKTITKIQGYEKMNIVFSSFNPIICVILSDKIGDLFPICFLTGSGMYPLVDDRCQSLAQALEFIHARGLYGVVSESTALSICTELVGKIKRNMSVYIASYGFRNCNQEDVNVQIRNGVDMIITDNVPLVCECYEKFKVLEK
ncbi:hypothetical protein BB560_007167 [Smittium megazygosporum]|uniref:GP-PDE domain-containing protein n=1 Tax=Smittium megazygosporum TaxID=133381 RepID=A0A2T9XYC3_9FUNG|nr:hypothetical protein BB560_007167 [Smittium megazygosporum]